MGSGETAWTIAEDLENFWVKWFNESMYNCRDQRRGGPDEAGNGMEMWRRLHMEFKGGSDLVEYGWRKEFKKYPGCTKSAISISNWMTGSLAV